MTESEIRKIIEKQQKFYQSGAALSLDFRRQALNRLKSALKKYENEIAEALRLDLGKSRMEGFMCETGLTISEITWMKKHLRSLARPVPVKTPVTNYVGKSFRSPHPYGTVLIMSPWNYPILLTLEPVADAIAAGNTVVIKPSAYSPESASVIRRIISEVFPEKYAAVITGGREENQSLLHQKFDKIFFTGGKTVGREVLRCAAENLTPVTLELGGKSPCIVDSTAKIPLAARRIVWGKYLNCGQTCVAPDYILCESSVKDALLTAIEKEITRQFGTDPLASPDYGKIINRKHYDRLLGLLPAADTDPAKENRVCRIYCGGDAEAEELRIAPTVLTDVSWNDPAMQEEIFGPILPVLTFDSLSEAIAMVNRHPHPLALYFFSEDRSAQKRILNHCQFGGGCINDTIIHLATSEMPFGGVGESGMGAYHGKTGFENFSHYRSIVDKKTWIDVPMRYQPFTKINNALLRAFLR